MSTVEFYYQNIRIFIYCREDEKMITICHNYCFKIQLDFNLVDFFYDGKKVNFELTFSEQANEKDKLSQKMKIVVIEKSQIKTQRWFVLNVEKLFLLKLKIIR